MLRRWRGQAPDSLPTVPLKYVSRLFVKSEREREFFDVAPRGIFSHTAIASRAEDTTVRLVSQIDVFIKRDFIKDRQMRNTALATIDLAGLVANAM